MTQATGRVLKSENVKVTEGFQLDSAPTTANVTASVQNQAQPTAVSQAIPQANIIHTGPDFAIIEIVCSCGTKTQVKCNYTDHD